MGRKTRAAPVAPAAGSLPPLEAEWLEPDGVGGFASGTVARIRRRRYHAILNAALSPPTGRTVLVSGFDAWIDRGDGSQPVGWLSAQRYTPDVATGTADLLIGFEASPWPAWTFRLPPGIEIRSELFVARPSGAVVLRWRPTGRAPGLRLVVRPFLAPRDLHALHHENPAFRFDAAEGEGMISWQPYGALPAIQCRHNGSYRHEPAWYRHFQLDEEKNRGFDYAEDAGSPGAFTFDLEAGDAVCIFAVGTAELVNEAAPVAAGRLERAERLRRGKLGDRLSRAADGYLVRRGLGKTIIAGYPWFTDWGRDTFIALRGLCLATGRLEDARSILLEWAGLVSEGMLPNRFVDQGDAPEFNSVDASLWYLIVAHEYRAAMADAGKRVTRKDRNSLEGATQAILEGFARGTRYGIHADSDGLLAAGVPGVQLTWMDAKLGDWVVTPRIGKPVEIQALWINALLAGREVDPRWGRLADRAIASFGPRFWNPAAGCLYDVVDVDGEPGRVDPSLRPNQIFAVGGLPNVLLKGARAEQVVNRVESALLTPLGLRSLGPAEPGFRPRYEGGPVARDGAYHQGTAWPWLLGAFVDGWLRVRRNTAAARAEARRRFFAPLEAHLDQAGLGHVSEIADATPPFTPRGCPFQAWSVGEAIRIDRMTRPPER